MAEPLPVPARPDRLYVSDKDPDYYYYWGNTKDINVMELQMDGYEPVYGQDPLMNVRLAQGAPGAPPLGTGQSTENPSAGVARQRGDLILFRIRKERYEETVGARNNEARERQSANLDTMILQANENARAEARKRGLKQIPKDLVFREE